MTLLRGGTHLRRLVRLVLLVVLVTSALVAAPAVAANDGIPDVASTSSVVYRLEPEAGAVRVTIELTIRNNIPDTATTRFYINEWSFYVEEGATDVSVRPASANISVTDTVGAFVVYRLTFPRTFKGETFRGEISYRLAGGAPRSEAATRIGAAYSAFCVQAQFTDRASVAVHIPGQYTVDQFGAELAQSERDSMLALDSGPDVDAYAFWACIEATNSAGFVRETSESGGGVVVLEAWPEDQQWLSSARTHVDDELRALEAIIGLPVPDERLVIREVASPRLGGYAGDYGSSPGLIRVSEDIDALFVVEHEMAHAWFNSDTLAENWLWEGLAEWAARSVVGLPCGVQPYPGLDSPRLREWQYLDATLDDATYEIKAAEVDWQYEAACFIVQEVADAIGEHAMHEVIAALLEGRPKYGGTGGITGGRVDWREWLDAVDEIGLRAAGTDDLGFVQELLLTYGVTTEAEQLAVRTDARSEYHRLLDDAPWRDLPLTVDDALDDWEFARALIALDAAEAILADVAAIERAFPTSDVAGDIKDEFVAAADFPRLAGLRDEVEGLRGQAVVAEAAMNDARPLLGGLSMPQAILDAVEANDFEAAIDLARRAGRWADALQAVDALLPKAGLVASTRESFATADAQSVRDGEALAARQRAAATTVAAGLERAAAQPDLLSSIGRDGDAVALLTEQSLAAVRAGDEAGARVASSALVAELDGAPTRGATIVAAGLAAMALMLLIALLVRRRRGRPA